LQRFISEDPLGFGGGDSNLYRYVRNSPHTKADPLGLTDGSGGGSDDEGDIDTLPDIDVTAPRNRGFGGFGDATPSFSGAGSFPRRACVACLVPAAGQMALDFFAVGLGLWLQRSGPLNITTSPDAPLGDKAEGTSENGEEGKSPNQLNKEIKQGKAPKDVERVDVGKVKGEQTHIHLKDGSVLNKDGT
ncbi:RHS repeat-associated core domain-containing protein, partial [Candidatus Cyanaurora vandensis]|uniref:RHS repeat-associated core domain-containing protein n=1 Tax=Candidatus Cyanaurora vandensis TaxID=2714958 RepID=UPI00257CAEEE